MSRIEEIRTRWEKVTPGPWEAERRASHGASAAVVRGRYSIARMGGMNLSERAQQEHRDNAEAIAHAPEDIAYLLNELKRRAIE